MQPYVTTCGLFFMLLFFFLQDFTFNQLTCICHIICLCIAVEFVFYNLSSTIKMTQSMPIFEEECISSEALVVSAY